MNNYEDGVAYWCEKHEHYSTGWRWEDQADKWLCGSCYQDFWDNENEELGD